MFDEFEDEYMDFEPEPFPLAEFEEVEMNETDIYDAMKQLETQQELDNRFEDFTEGMSIEELTNFRNTLLEGNETLCEYFDISKEDVSGEGNQKVYK